MKILAAFPGSFALGLAETMPVVAAVMALCAFAILTATAGTVYQIVTDTIFEARLNADR